jgi:hypothetical protein
MHIKKYLQTSNFLNKGELAKLIWPGMESSEAYLNQIITNERPFTQEDAERALDVLRQLAVQFNSLELKDDYPDD